MSASLAENMKIYALRIPCTVYGYVTVTVRLLNLTKQSRDNIFSSHCRAVCAVS